MVKKAPTSGSKSRTIPKASNTSALPQAEELDLFPCCGTDTDTSSKYDNDSRTINVALIDPARRKKE